MSKSDLTTGEVPIADTTLITYNDLVIACDVDSEGADVVVSGKMPKRAIYHKGEYEYQSQTVKLVINREELVQALRGDL